VPGTPVEIDAVTDEARFYEWNQSQMLKQLTPEQIRDLLQAGPAGLMLLDDEGVVRWLNDTLSGWLGERADTLTNRGEQTAPEALRPLFRQDATLNLAAGESSPEMWLVSTSTPVKGGGLAQYFIDVSAVRHLLQERDVLNGKLESLLVEDAMTGMPNHRALVQSMESQVSRSRRYGNALSILVLKLDNQMEIVKRLGLASPGPLLIALRNMLNDQFRWADIIGRLNADTFLLILPETSLEATSELSKMLRNRLAGLKLTEAQIGECGLQYAIGIAEWKKGDDPDLLLQRAQQALQA